MLNAFQGRPPKRLAPCDATAGFTLLEVIVALAVLAISLTLAMRTLSGGFDHQQRARVLSEAAAIAQSLLARLGGDLALRPGEENGTVPGGMAWQIRIEPYGSASERKDWPVAAYSVLVRVFPASSMERPLFELKTLRLGSREGRQR